MQEFIEGSLKIDDAIPANDNVVSMSEFRALKAAKRALQIAA